MYFHHYLAAFVAFFAAGLTAKAAPPLARLVPEDAALAVVASDIPGLVAGIQQSPYWQTAMDPSVQRFFAPMIKEFKWSEALAAFRNTTGFTSQELFGMAKGEAVVFLTDFDFVFDPETRNQPPLVLAVDFGDNAGTIDRLIGESIGRQKDEGTVQQETESYAGVSLHSVIPQAKIENRQETEQDTLSPRMRKQKEPSPFHWAVTEGLLIVAASKLAMINFLDGLHKGGVDAPLERSTRYVRLLERVGASQFALMMHFPKVIPALQRAITEQAASVGVNQFVLDPSAILGALGMDVWQDFYMAGQVDSSATVNHYGLTASEDRGLLKIVHLGDGPFPRPSWIPEKWTSVSTARFSLKNAFAALEEMVRDINPALEGMAQGAMAQFGKKVGIDIKRDLFGSFGDEFIQAQFFSNEPGVKSMESVDQFYAFSVENAPALIRALDGLKGLLGPAVDKVMEPREYLGHTLYALNLPNAQGKQGFTYAVTDRYLLLGIGSPSTIENALQGISGQGDSYWDKPEIKLALTRVPENASGFQRQDLGPLVSAVFDALASLPAPVGEVAAVSEEIGEIPPAARSFPVVVDPSEKPLAETIARYWGENLTYSFRDSEGIHAISRLSHPPP